MPKGKNKFIRITDPQNGRRAVKGQWGITGKVSYNQLQNKLKHKDFINCITQQQYIKKNIQITDEIEYKETK
jgi:hypothetical protein